MKILEIIYAFNKDFTAEDIFNDNECNSLIENVRRQIRILESKNILEMIEGKKYSKNNPPVYRSIKSIFIYPKWSTLQNTMAHQILKIAKKIYNPFKKDDIFKGIKNNQINLITFNRIFPEMVKQGRLKKYNNFYYMIPNKKIQRRRIYLSIKEQVIKKLPLMKKDSFSSHELYKLINNKNIKATSFRATITALLQDNILVRNSCNNYSIN